MVPERYFIARRIAKRVRAGLDGWVRQGMLLLRICEEVERRITEGGGKLAFPCGIGINEVAAHYSPTLEDMSTYDGRSLMKIDFGVHVDGYLVDTAITLSKNVGFERLVNATRVSLSDAVTAAKTGKIGRISSAIERAAESRGFRTIENLGGHTIERFKVHAGKGIPNSRRLSFAGLELGEVFAIEPFLTLGGERGSVVQSQQKTIYALAERKKVEGILDDFVERVWEERRSLPFSPRWFARRYDRKDLQDILERLEQRGVVSAYPTLVEKYGRPVMQFEHTLVMGENGPTVLV